MQPERQALLAKAHKAQAAKRGHASEREPRRQNVDAGQVVPLKPKANGKPSADGAEALDNVRAFISKYCILPSPAALDAVTLWAAHTWVVEVLDTTPRLAVLAAEAESGKTRVLELLEQLVRAPEKAGSSTAAAIFRLVDAGHEDDGELPTLLLDEAQHMFRPARGSDPGGGDIRAIVNDGYRRGATAQRCDGPNNKVKRFRSYAPVAMAGLKGFLPDDTRSRSIVIRMRRRAPGERVASFRYRTVIPEAEPIRDALSSWMRSVVGRAGSSIPEMPAGVTDRSADVWDALLTVADLAGGHWPETARTACAEFVLGGNEVDDLSVGEKLLAKMREVLTDERAMSTADLLARINADDELPFGAWNKGNGASTNWLCHELREHEVRTKNVRPPGSAATTNGYHIDQFADAFARYLPPDTEPAAEDTNPFAEDPASIAGGECCEGGDLQVRCSLCQQSPTYYRRQQTEGTIQ